MTKKIYNDRCFEILSLYSQNWKAEFYTREIARLTNNKLGTVQLSLAKLKDGKIIVSKLKGKHKYWNLNLKNPLTKYFLEMVEIYKTSKFLVKYTKLFSFLREIAKLNINGLIVIFGSFAKSEATKNSDLDILIIGDKKEKVEKIKYLLPCKLHCVELTNKNFIDGLNKKDFFVKEILENHIILTSTSKWINILGQYYER